MLHLQHSSHTNLQRWVLNHVSKPVMLCLQKHPDKHTIMQWCIQPGMVHQNQHHKLMQFKTSRTVSIFQPSANSKNRLKTPLSSLTRNQGDNFITGNSSATLTQASLEHIRSRQMWPFITRIRQSNTRHRHDTIHHRKWNPKRQTTWCHTQQFRMHHTPLESGP